MTSEDGEVVDLITALQRSVERARDDRRRIDVPGTVQTFPDLVQRTPPWYAQRCGLITASAIGKLLAVRTLSAVEYVCPACGAEPDEPCRSKTKAGQANKTVHAERTARAAEERESSPLIIETADTDEARGLVLAAAAERISGFVDPTWVSLDMQRGVDDEPYAVEAYSEHHAVVVPCGFMVRTWPGGFTLGYSPDGLVGADGLIEVKSRRGKTQVQTVLAGRIPAENLAQCQAGLFVSGRAWLDYVSYAGGLHLWTERVYPDPQWFDAIRTAVEDFESAVDRAVSAYREAVKGLPLTERPPEDMVI